MERGSERDTALVFSHLISSMFEEILGDFHVAIDDSKMDSCVVFHSCMIWGDGGVMEGGWRGGGGGM